MVTECNNKGYYPKVTGKKRKVAEELASPEFDGNITQLCSRQGVSRTTFYRWLDEMEFKGYIDYLIEKYTDSELSNAWRALVKKANTGNVEALKLFFEMKNLYKQTVNVNSGVVFITGEDDLPE